MYSESVAAVGKKYIISKLVRGALGVVLMGSAVLAYAPPAQAAVADWQKGMTIYPSSSTDYGSDGFKQVVNHYRSLGFNYITLIIPIYQSNTGSTDIQAGWNTPTDASLAAGIQYIHAQGMHVTLNVHLDSYDGTWRAYINPGDRNTWFANYKNMLTKYATIAMQNGAESYCLGTELVSMASTKGNPDNTQRWLSMIQAVRSIYSGKVFYDANWGGGDFEHEVPNIGFWGALDYIGISAYYELHGDGSVASLKSDWDAVNNSDVGAFSRQFGKPVLFSEIGYRSNAGAHNAPWDSWSQNGYSAQEQVNDYQAMFEYWNNYNYMQGFDIWYSNTDSGSGGDGNTDYLILNKPVEQTISQWLLNPPQGGTGGGTTGGGATGGGTASSATFSAAGSTSGSASGQPVSLTASVTDTAGAASNVNVDLEVYNASNQNIFQKIYTGQNFSGGQTQTFSGSWTPSATGTYSFKIGVFSGDWSALYVWNDQAATINVANSSVGTTGGDTSAGGGTATTPAGSYATDIWWPANGVTVSGVQPFKAMLENLSTPQYSMFWQVDGDALNPMGDSATDYPHKEALVDLTNWTWNGGGPYTINFVSKNSSGAVIGQKSVQISVAH